MPDFDFKMCWTCDHCLLDIGIDSYICGRDSHIIGHNYEACKPTECKDWIREKGAK